MSSAATNKGARTRELIVEAGHELARRVGLDGLTFGTIAAEVKMSKSGLFAHFGSREGFQLAVLEHAINAVGDAVFAPAFAQPRGLPRLSALISGWLAFVSGLDRGGCVVLAAVAEFDDKPGPIRDALVGYQHRLRRQMERTIQMTIDAGDFRADADPAQVAFEFYAVLLALHHDLRLFNDQQAVARTAQAANHVLQRYLAEPRQSAAIG